MRAVKLSDIQSVTARAKLLAAGEVGQGPTVAENCERRRRDGGGGGTRRGESARGAVAEATARAAEAWEVVGGEEGEWRGRGGGKRGRERGTRGWCVELQGSDAAAGYPCPCCCCCLLLEGCALKRRCAGCGPSEPLLHPFDCPSLGAFPCKLHVSILSLTLIVSVYVLFLIHY